MRYLRDTSPRAPWLATGLFAGLWPAHGDQAELRGEGMPPSGPHDYYEAWLADARGRMVSMGTFRVARDGRVEAHVPIAVNLRDYRVIEVSLEPDDGDPAHSSRSVMRARL